MIVRFRRWLQHFIRWAAPVLAMTVAAMALGSMVFFYSLHLGIPSYLGGDFYAYLDAAERLAGGPFFWLVPSMLLLLDGIRRTRLPEVAPRLPGMDVK